MIPGEKYLQPRIRLAGAKSAFAKMAFVRLALAGALVLLTACSQAFPTAGPPAATSQPPFSPSHTPTPTPTPSPPQPTGITIPFETIEKSELGSGVLGIDKYNETGASKAPRFILVTRAADVAKLDGLVSDQALEQARALDFGEDWAVAVFAGVKPTSGYHAEIVGVVSKDGQVIVKAVLQGPPQNPPPGTVLQLNAVVTLPYHLILLNKEGLIGKKTFSFEANGEVIQRFEVDLSQR